MEDIKEILRHIAKEVESSHALLIENKCENTARILEDTYDRIILLADIYIERNKQYVKGIRTVERYEAI